MNFVSKFLFCENGWTATGIAVLFFVGAVT
jgi:hypothetical protein